MAAHPPQPEQSEPLRTRARKGGTEPEEVSLIPRPNAVFGRLKRLSKLGVVSRSILFCLPAPSPYVGGVGRGNEKVGTRPKSGTKQAL